MNGRSDYGLQQIEQEQAEVELYRAIIRFHRLGKGEEEILSIIAEVYTPNRIKRTLDTLADDTFKVETKITKFK